MGFTSYREDQVERRFDGSKESINHHRKSRGKEIGISGFRKESDIDTKENGDLKKRNRKIQKQVEAQRVEIEQLVKDREEAKKQIDQYRKQIDRYRHERANLLPSRKKIENDYSELSLEVFSLLQEMKNVTRSNGWFKDKDNLRRLAELIDNGLRKTR